MSKKLFKSELSSHQAGQYCLYTLPFPDRKLFKFGITDKARDRLITHVNDYGELGNDGLLMFSDQRSALIKVERALKAFYRDEITAFVESILKETGQKPTSTTEILPLNAITSFKRELFVLLENFQLNISNPLHLYENAVIRNKLAELELKKPTKQPKSSEVKHSENDDEYLGFVKAHYKVIERTLPIYLASIVSATLPYIDDNWGLVSIKLHSSALLASKVTGQTLEHVEKAISEFDNALHFVYVNIRSSYCGINVNNEGRERFETLMFSLHREEKASPNVIYSPLINIPIRLLSGIAQHPVMDSMMLKRFGESKSLCVDFLYQAALDNHRLIGSPALLRCKTG